MAPKEGYGKGAGIWYVRGITDKGHKYFKSTGIKKTRKDAPNAVHIFERELRQELDADPVTTAHGVYVPANMPVELKSLELLYWERLETRAAKPETKASYTTAWRRLHAFFDCAEKWQSVHHLAVYSRMRQNDGAAPPTVVKELNVLLGAYKVAKEGGMPLPAKPARPNNFDPYDSEMSAATGKYITPEDFYRFYRELKKQRNGQESSDRMLLCFLTGLRWGETQRLQKDMVLTPIVTEPGLVRIARVLGKNKRFRSIPLGPLGWAIYSRAVPFPSKSNHQGVTRLCKRLGLESTYHLRDCRATFATETADAMVSQASIDAVMGHANGMPPKYQKAHARRLAKIALEAETIFADAKASVESEECGHSVDHAARLKLIKNESA